jgi:hypothetical protein
MTDVTPYSSLPKVVEWRDFLTNYPPGTRGSVEGIADLSSGHPKILMLELQLYCNGSCANLSYCIGQLRTQGLLFPAGSRSEEVMDYVLVYSCRKCQAHVKSYAIRIIGRQWRDGIFLPSMDVAKMAEWPDFSFDISPKLNALLRPDRELFLKGKKCESSGLGIGAFSYYRRIVEDQKNRLFDEIILAARRLNAAPDAVSRLEAARAETQFGKAVDMIKDALPESLLIKGHNPLKLLHNALSRNLHGASDETCLQAAHDIRVVLFELADRLGEALKEQNELNEAVSRLLSPVA